MSLPTGAHEPVVSASAHQSRYEALRAHAIGSERRVTHDGLAVLLRQGVAAWMEAWSKLPGPPPRATIPIGNGQCPLLKDSSSEVIRVLVTMTLGQLQEVST